MTDPDRGIMVTTGIVGGGLRIANGLTLAAKLKEDGRVALCNFGDGAANIGAFHEALNLVSLWKLPVVFVCQNNGYGEHTPVSRHLAVEHVADRAAAYGMAGMTVDGNDPIAMYEAAKAAIDRARAGDGPTLLESKTFRLMGHHAFDDCSYMPEGFQSARSNDPMARFRSRLIVDGVASEPELT